MQNRVGGWKPRGRVFLFLIACPVLLATIAPLAARFPALPPGLFVGAVTSIATLGLTVVFVRWEGLAMKDVGAAVGKGSPYRLVIGFFLGLLLSALFMALVGFVGHVQWVRSGSVGFLDVFTLLIAYLLLASREELAFRGYPLRRLKSMLGLWPAQLIIALVFAAEHVIGGATWAQALYGAAVGSLLFGMAAIATGGLAVPIGLHAAWNFGDWMHGGKGPGGVWKAVVADGFTARAELVGIVAYVTVMMSATLAFWWWHRRKRRLDVP